MKTDVGLRVHYAYDGASGYLPYIRSLLDPGIVFTAGEELARGPDLDVLVIAHPSREDLLACPNLQALILPQAGVAPEVLAMLAEFPQISLHNMHHSDIATAESALALLLAASKWIVPVDRTFRRHDWSPRYQPPPITVLDGSTALVLGYGAIGRRLARACQALNMTMLATRRSAGAVSHDGVAEVHPAADLHGLLPRAQVLLITLPLTAETEGLIGAAELALLPPGAVLVNVGRGPIVDEAELYQALHEGRLAAAGLDVWWRYPQEKAARTHTPPSAYPFHELDNVVMSPHRAGMGVVDALERRRYAVMAEALNQAASGLPLPNRIDPARGY